MGYIYIIKNTVNDKVYVGQTVNSVKSRFSRHKLAACKGTSKLYINMRSIGIDKFYIEEICKCSNRELNKLEIEYIAKYNSYHNGYNSTQGGAGGEHNELYEEAAVKEFITDYNNKTLFELCAKYKVSETFIYSLLNTLGICANKDSKKHRYSREAIQICMYSIEFEPMLIFDSLKNAMLYCNNKLNYKVNEWNGYGRLKVACQNGNIAYGHRWQLASDLVYDDKIFRTKFDKEAYIQGKPAYQPEGKQYYIVDGALDLVFKHYRNNTKHPNTCIDCDKEISKHAMRCKECNDKYSETDEDYKNKVNYSSKCPDIDTLRNLLSEYNYTQIGKMYNVSANAVKKWALKYDLLKEKKEKPSKEELENLLRAYSTKQVAEMYNVHPGTVNWWASNYNIERTKFDRVKCIELDLVFNSKSEAARYLIENKLTTRTDIHNLAYGIGVSIDTRSKYQGFNWIYMDK